MPASLACKSVLDKLLVSSLPHSSDALLKSACCFDKVITAKTMSFFSRFFWAACVMLFVASPHQSRGAVSPRTVQTKYGTLRGTIHEMRATKMQPVEMFLGVPYAAPPVGSLRFMPPVTPRAWADVFLADRHSPVCPQKLQDISDRKEALKRMPVGRYKYLKRLYGYLKEQSENCLHLNIYLPAAGKFFFDMIQ